MRWLCSASCGRQALRAKLVVEAREAEAAQDMQLVTALANVLEVVDALRTARAIAREVVFAAQEWRRANRGGFTGKLYLVRTE